MQLDQQERTDHNDLSIKGLHESYVSNYKCDRDKIN